MILADRDYGIFTNLVGAAGTIIAMGVALGFGWRGRTKWEPSDQDLEKGAQKVGGLVGAVLIAFIFITYKKPEDVPTLRSISLWCLLATVVSLLVYGWLILNFIYVQYGDTPQARNIIGGLFLDRDAKTLYKKVRADHIALGQFPPTKQEFFKGALYDIAKLWSGSSRFITKSLFNLAYFGLTICGTLALACAAIAIGFKQ